VNTDPTRHTDGPVVAACDLDRTLVYSRAAARLGLQDGVPLPPVHGVETYNGEQISHLTPRSSALLAELGERALFVPTTTRTREQYHRISLPGPFPTYAICANGGHLLVDGVSDPDWHESVLLLLAAAAAPLEEVNAYLDTVRDEPWALKHRTAEDLFSYLVVDRAAMPGAFLDDTTAWAAARGWGVSLQGRKLYLVPDTLTKGAAVREVARRSGARAVLAAGDSLLDIELLKAADLGIRPGHGELAETGWTAPHVTALDSLGVQAGEDILEWLVARVDDLDRGRTGAAV
jgi:hypothetical protein